MIEKVAPRQPLLDTATGRYVLAEEGATAVLNFEESDGRLVIEHVVVPDEISGRGIGGALVAAAVDRAKAEGLTIVPWCPFARHWLRANPREAAGMTIDWKPRPRQ